MEKCKNQLKKEYNTAVDFYNKGDYEHYFFHIRKSIEYFGKYLIFDTMQKCGEIENANYIISGEYSFNIDNRGCTLSKTPQQREPEGSFFVKLAQFALYYVQPLLLNPAQEAKQKRRKTKIDSCLNSLIDYYNTASEISMHTGNSSALDPKTQADSCASFFVKVFNDLKSTVSAEASTFFEKLDIPKEESQNNIYIESAIRRTNDFSMLDDITNRLVCSTDERYVAFMPENIKDNYGDILNENQIKDLFRINWHFIVDLNKKTFDGLYEQTPAHKKSSIRIITDDISEVTGTFNITNWLFAQGRQDLGCLDEASVMRTSPKTFSKTFSKIVRTGSTKDYIIFDFCEKPSKLLPKLYDKLEDVFDDWDTVARRCKIISFSTDEEYQAHLIEWASYTGVIVHFVNASFSDFLVHINDVLPPGETYQIPKVLVRGKSLDLSEARDRYHAAGIDFYYPNKDKKGQSQWDFYAGAEITWHELENQCDVQRDLYRIVRSRITELIRSSRKTTVFTLRHRPGSGATTLSKRLGYDITKDDEAGILSCTVVDIKSCSNLRITDQYLGQLSERLENTPLLAIVESKYIGREKFDYLVQRMSKAGKKIIFFYIEPFTGQYFVPKENVVLLESTLKSSELRRFEEKYTQLGLDLKLLENRKLQNNNIEVVDFPLMLKDNDTSANLLSYVKEWMSNLPENLIKFCAFVGFVFKYSDLGVNQTLLKSIWKIEDHYSIMSYPPECVNAIKKLLIEEVDNGLPNGVWRPRYNRFSSFILNSYKDNWESSISEIAKEFISLCKLSGELGSDDKDMLYSIFVIRKNADYRALEERKNIKNKFSLLVKDINDIERAESLFLSLVESFPEDAVFRGHFARFLYEKASMSKSITIDDRLYVDAQYQLTKAFDINPDDSDLYHMQGMLLRRRIGTLARMHYNDIQKNDSSEVDLIGIRDCLEEWVQTAFDAFEKSIQLSPGSPYGYAAESQLFRDAIDFGQKLLNVNDYSFCETDYVFAEYTEKLGNVLDQFEQVCYAFKNEGLTQILDSYYIYEQVRAYHENLIGRNKEAIEKYRKMYNGTNDEKKLFYGHLLVKSIVYSKSSKKDTRKAYRNLTFQERKEIEKVLEYQKNKGDIKSYETLFLLKLYGSDEFSLDDAIDLLKEWENQYYYNNQLGWGYLNACFYLAVCYCAKAIKRAVPNLELKSLSESYFKKASDFANKFDKGTVLPQCYLGERDDIHCIVDKNMKDSDADTVIGVIHRIRNNNGILKLLCGIEVTFNARGFDILHDEGQPLRGVLGFSYSGPGLYDFRRENACMEDIISFDEQDESETSFEDLNESYAPIENLVEEEPTTQNSIDTTQSQIKIVGKIDPAELDNLSRKKIRENTFFKVYEEGEIVHGTISRDQKFVSGPGGKCTIDKKSGFAIGFSPKECDYEVNRKVIFKIKIGKNINNPNLPWYYATQIKPDE